MPALPVRELMTRLSVLEGTRVILLQALTPVIAGLTEIETRDELRPTSNRLEMERYSGFVPDDSWEEALGLMQGLINSLAQQCDELERAKCTVGPMERRSPDKLSVTGKARNAKVAA